MTELDKPLYGETRVNSEGKATFTDSNGKVTELEVVVTQKSDDKGSYKDIEIKQKEQE
jgi:hypothetical protein